MLKFILILTLCAGVFAQTVEKTALIEPVKYETFVASAYALKGKMANGQKAHSGAVAADPRLLPIGSIIYIDGMGTYTVKDTGGAIKGRRLDIWMSSLKAAFKFGKRKVQVRILSKPKRI